MINCDPDTGICTIENSADSNTGSHDISSQNTIFYFGDPMCSWCWGIAPEVDKLKKFYENKLQFKLVMGGLRPGGGEPWNKEMKEYLKGHWRHVNQKSGQPFNFHFFERDSFDYNTEPSCRAVKTFENHDRLLALPSYHAIQHRFYAENEDPSDIEFYVPICKKLDVSYDLFKDKFESDQIRQLTQKDFQFTQRIGVSAFPTLLLQYENQIQTVAYGYSTFELMKQRIEQFIKTEV